MRTSSAPPYPTARGRRARAGSPRRPTGRRSCSTSTGRSRRSSAARGRARAGGDARGARAARRPLRARRLRQRPAGRRTRGGSSASTACVYVGEHGLELEPEAPALARAAPARSRPASTGRVEDKGLTVAFHYREAEDEDAALAYLEEVAERARAAGLVPRFGRKVLEVRPPVEARQGHGRAAAARGARAAARALRRRRHDRPRRVPRRSTGSSSRCGSRSSSDEAPSELASAADVVVASPAELLRLLRRL